MTIFRRYCDYYGISMGRPARRAEEFEKAKNRRSLAGSGGKDVDKSFRGRF